MTAAPVVGGSLGLHELAPGDGPLVLALHGITSNALAWLPVASALRGRVRLVAPDLRGRADSRAVTGPFGLGAHADDVRRVLDHLGAETAVLLGHSMGAFVAALAAARCPDRVTGVLLVDGGLGFSLAAGVDADTALAAVLGPALARLPMTFASDEEYLTFWSQHPAVSGLLSGETAEAVRRHLLHDLVPDGRGALRSSCVADAVRADGAGVLADVETHAAVAASSVPTTLVWAERGLLDQPQGLYDSERLAALALPSRVRVRKAEDTNHYDVVLGRRGAAVVAEELLALTG
jgi:pimeloyl-ACP methyl ester carboxylesterase